MVRFLPLFALVAVALAQTRHIDVIAHRGEHLRHAENSLPAIEESIRLGANYVELDIRTTSDGRLVLMHDARVDRTTKGKGEVASMTLAEISALNVPTFEAALAVARGRIGIYVDVKKAATADLLTAIEKHEMLDRVVVYCNPAQAREILALKPQVRVMPEAGSAERLRSLIAELKLKVAAFDANDFKDDAIRVAREADVKIFVDRLGAADNEAAWRDAIARGADGIQTDRPAELIQFLKSLKKP